MLSAWRHAAIRRGIERWRDSEIARIKTDYAVYSSKGDASPGGGYLVNHSRQAYLMDPQGKPIAILPIDKTPEAVASELEKWVR